MKYIKRFNTTATIKPASIFKSFGVNSWKPVILGVSFQKKVDFYYRNAIFFTFCP